MEIKFSEGKPMSYYCERVDLQNGSFTYLADKLEKKGALKEYLLKEIEEKRCLF
jgi:hypothetical protein